MLGDVRVGSGEQHAPLRILRAAGPYLLSRHHPLVAVLNCPGPHGGEVGTSLGLGEPLAPDLVRADDRGQIALALRGGAVRHDRRASQQQTDHVGRQGRICASKLLEEDRGLRERRAPTPVLRGPIDGRPSAFRQAALEIAPPSVNRIVADRRRPRMVDGKPVAQFAAERLLASGERQVHWSRVPSRLAIIFRAAALVDEEAQRLRHANRLADAVALERV